MSSRHISLLRSADNFLKNAGILEAPPKMLAQAVSWAKSIYCSHLLERINKISWANNHRIELHDKLVAMVEDPLFAQFKEALANVSDTGEDVWNTLAPKYKPIVISYFNNEEYDKTTESEGVYEWVDHLPVLDLYIHDFKNGRCNIFLSINYLKMETSINVRLTDVSKQKAIDLINQYSRVMYEIVDDFQHFTYYSFETFSDSRKKELGALRATCLKHIQPDTGRTLRLPLDFADSKYFNVKDLDILREKMLGEFRQPIVYCEFIFNEGEAGRIYSGSKWSGLWTGKLYIYRDENAKLPSPFLNEMEDILSDIAETVRHELQHLMQTYIDYVRGIKDKAGLPGRKERSLGRNPHGYQQTQNISQEQKEGTPRLPHELRDIEFYPRLADTIDKYKNAITKIPLQARKMFFSVWVGQTPEMELEKLIEHIAQKEGRWGSFNEWEHRMYVVRNTLRQEQRQFVAMKTQEPRKYMKAVKEMWKVLSNDGLV